MIAGILDPPHGPPVMVNRFLCEGDVYMMEVDGRKVAVVGSKEVLEFMVKWTNEHIILTSPPTFLVDGQILETVDFYKALDVERRRRFKCFDPGTSRPPTDG